MGLLRRDEPSQTPDEFWTEIEEKHGGKVTFFTFTKFLGRSQASPENLPGLLYIINNVLYFEDFEKDNMLAKLIGRKKKFEKTEFNIALDRLSRSQIVLRGQALNCIAGMVAGENIRPISKFRAFFSTPVYQLMFEDGESFFFEQVMDQKQFFKALSGNEG
jgi:hypothetical protein